MIFQFSFLSRSDINKSFLGISTSIQELLTKHKIGSIVSMNLSYQHKDNLNKYVIRSSEVSKKAVSVIIDIDVAWFLGLSPVKQRRTLYLSSFEAISKVINSKISLAKLNEIKKNISKNNYFVSLVIWEQSLLKYKYSIIAEYYEKYITFKAERKNISNDSSAQIEVAKTHPSSIIYSWVISKFYLEGYKLIISNRDKEVGYVVDFDNRTVTRSLLRADSDPIEDDQNLRLFDFILSTTTDEKRREIMST